MPRIANGADLMLPGVIINDEKGIKAYCDGKLNKGKNHYEKNLKRELE